MKTSMVDRNKQGHFFDHGKAFDQVRLVQIISTYQAKLDMVRKRSIDCHDKFSKIRHHLADKMITFHRVKYIFATEQRNLKGVG